MDEVPGDTYILQFDGGTTKGLGVGGNLIWDRSGTLLRAKSLWFGDTCTTNNEAELGALAEGVGWIGHQGLPPGNVMVIGDSNLVLGYCTKRFRPQQKFIPQVQ